MDQWKTMDEWFRDNPVVVLHIMRAYINASHLIVMEELREIQSLPFDPDAEVDRLFKMQLHLTELFDLQFERAQAQRVKEKREARRKEKER